MKIIMVGIYRILNTLNHKCYIGQSIDIAKRWYNHKNDLHRHAHDNEHLQLSWDKYGEDIFLFEILEECKVSELNGKEKYWIDYYNAFNPQYGYNINPNPYKSVPVKLTDEKVNEIIDLLRTSTLNQVQIAERYNVSADMIRAINHGRYWRQGNISYPISGSRKFSKRNSKQKSTSKKQDITYKVHTLDLHEFQERLKSYSIKDVAQMYDVTPKTIRVWYKKFNLEPSHRKCNEENKIKVSQVKKVQQISPEGHVVNTFKSTREAARYLGDERKCTHIADVCNGKRKTAYCFLWKYVV